MKAAFSLPSSRIPNPFCHSGNRYPVPWKLQLTFDYPLSNLKTDWPLRVARRVVSL